MTDQTTTKELTPPELLYARFSNGDVDGMLALLTSDVEWVNEPKGEHVEGKVALRAHWERQWNAAKIELSPVDIAPTDSGVLVVVQERVSTHSGKVLFEGRVGHAYTIRDGLIARCDIVDAP